MTKKKQTLRGGPGRVCYGHRHVSNDGSDGNRLSLIRETITRLHADDFKPGSHLEAGEPEKRRICPFDEIGSGGATTGYALTLSSEPQQRRASVGRDKAGVLYLEHIEIHGMSEYPHRHIQSQNGR